MKSVLNISVCLIVMIALFGPSGSVAGSYGRDLIDTPTEAQSVAAGWIIDRIGQVLFDSHVLPSGCTAHFVEDSQLVSFDTRWKLKFDSEQEPDFEFRVTVYFGGVVYGDRRVPDCRVEPGLCKIVIGRSEAILIAESRGLVEGLEPWNLAFRLAGQESPRFIWRVTNVTQKSDSKSRGHYIDIDASSGFVVKQRGYEHCTRSGLPN
jgi:hypothetical protein